MVPFGEKNVIRYDRTQLHVLIDTGITGEATHTRERHIVSIAELTLILLRARSSTLLKQHVQLLRIVMKSWQIVYRERDDDHEATSRSCDKNDGTSLTLDLMTSQ